MNSHRSELNNSSILIRNSTPEDLSSCAAIFRDAVLNTTGTFQTDPPSDAAFVQRYTTSISQNLPFIVSHQGEQILGYAYAGQFRLLAAYRFCVEDSLYVRSDARGQGVGQMLLEELIKRCEEAGMRQMVAMIGDSENLGSVRVHEKCGFEHTGLLKKAGWKFGRWVDVVLMQRQLGKGADEAPVEREDLE